MRRLEQEEREFLSREPSHPARPPSVVSWVGLPVSGISSQGVLTGGGGGVRGSYDGNGAVHNGGSTAGVLGKAGSKCYQGAGAGVSAGAAVAGGVIGGHIQGSDGTSGSEAIGGLQEASSHVQAGGSGGGVVGVVSVGGICAGSQHDKYEMMRAAVTNSPVLPARLVSDPLGGGRRQLRNRGGRWCQRILWE